MPKQILSTISTAAVGTTWKETALGGVVAAFGTAIAALLGGWDITLQILLYAMAFDYVTGFLAAAKEKRIDSDIMLWGGVRKVVVLGVIGLCVQLDALFGYETPVLRAASFYFYIGREGLSIIENLGKLNVLVPDVVKDRLQQLKGNKDI